MKMLKKVLITALALGLLTSTGLTVLAGNESETIPNSSVSISDHSIIPMTIKTVEKTFTTYQAQHNIEYTYTASADVKYDSALGRYVMSNITVSRANIKTYNGTNATVTYPTVALIDGGRNAEMKATFTVQNSTGGQTTIYATNYLYCATSTGNLTLG